uniref:Thioredoxin n=3 Tax=Timema TaxID=61471 RepID=A0A7R9J8Q0_TIMCA|nr:unnamed protein product [Timema douglasi]CAD7402729.1 unnamed protein product [Timema poppensis]CAD7574562.1 unnamed protein product [Timema californicum]
MSYHVKDKADFDAKLAEAGDNLVVVDFFAVWCGPCKMIAPKLEEMAAEYPDIVVLKVDVDECEDLVAIYEISSMPTFVFIKNKAKVESFSGSNAEKLKALVLQLK